MTSVPKKIGDLSKKLMFVPKNENYVWVTKINNGHNPYLVFKFLTSVLF
jgi:hypothetical protein